MNPTTPAPEKKSSSTNDTEIPVVFTDEKDQINPDTLALLLLSLNTFYKAAEKVLRDTSDDAFLADPAGFTKKVMQTIRSEYSSEGHLVFATDSPGFVVVSLAYGSPLKLGLRGTARLMLIVAALTGGKVKTGPLQVEFPGIIPTLQKTYEVVAPDKGHYETKVAPVKTSFQQERPPDRTLGL